MFVYFVPFQEESGAQITIGKPEPKNPTDRVITIKVKKGLTCSFSLQLQYVTEQTGCRNLKKYLLEAVMLIEHKIPSTNYLPV